MRHRGRVEPQRSPCSTLLVFRPNRTHLRRTCAALTKVFGEADAALAYVTDVVAAGSAVEGIDAPEAQQVINNYPVALLAAEAPNPDAGQAFIDYLRSDEARQVFEHAGFAPRERRQPVILALG